MLVIDSKIACQRRLEVFLRKVRSTDCQNTETSLGRLGLTMTEVRRRSDRGREIESKERSKVKGLKVRSSHKPIAQRR